MTLSSDSICAAVEALRYLSEHHNGHQEPGSTHHAITPVVAKALAELEQLRDSLRPEEQWTIPNLAGPSAEVPLTAKGKAVLSGEYWDNRQFFDNLPPEPSPIPAGVVPGTRDRLEYFQNTPPK